jgi:hypothetical protein
MKRSMAGWNWCACRGGRRMGGRGKGRGCVSGDEMGMETEGLEGLARKEERKVKGPT